MLDDDLENLDIGGEEEEQEIASRADAEDAPLLNTSTRSCSMPLIKAPRIYTLNPMKN
jgi:hypothetical protein